MVVSPPTQSCTFAKMNVRGMLFKDGRGYSCSSVYEKHHVDTIAVPKRASSVPSSTLQHSVPHTACSLRGGGGGCYYWPENISKHEPHAEHQVSGQKRVWHIPSIIPDADCS